MDRVLPIAEAVLMGTVDSIENFAINLRDKLPRLGQQQDPFPCMDGKVGWFKMLVRPLGRPQCSWCSETHTSSVPPWTRLAGALGTPRRHRACIQGRNHAFVPYSYRVTCLATQQQQRRVAAAPPRLAAVQCRYLGHSQALTAAA